MFKQSSADKSQLLDICEGSLRKGSEFGPETASLLCATDGLRLHPELMMELRRSITAQRQTSVPLPKSLAWSEAWQRAIRQSKTGQIPTRPQ